MKRTWTFDRGRNGFSFEEDTFRFADPPQHAAGRHFRNGGHEGGALAVKLGGDDAPDGVTMSGAWRKAFWLDEAQPVTLTFRYKIKQPGDWGGRDVTGVRVALDGEPVARDGKPVVARLFGDGPGGGDRSTGWKTVTLDLGDLGRGRHVLELEGFARSKGAAGQPAKVLFDEVTVATFRLAPFEARVLALTNDFRAEHGLAPLRVDPKLSAAAEDWSRTMAEEDFFRHSTPAQVEEHGYAWRSWGENIAAGYATPEAVVRGWIDSPGHRANLLSESFREIGIGYHFEANDGGSLRYHHYWTQAFGTEADLLG